jgi:hypothetical protein
VYQAVNADRGDSAICRRDWHRLTYRAILGSTSKGFARIVEKRALTEQVARLFVREQVSRALSTFR